MPSIYAAFPGLENWCNLVCCQVPGMHNLWLAGSVCIGGLLLVQADTILWQLVPPTVYITVSAEML